MHSQRIGIGNLCIDTLKHVGYQTVVQRVIDAADFGGVTRIRWLALAVRRHDERITRLPFETWPNFGQLTMGMLDALFQEQVPDSEALQVTKLMLSCAQDTTFLPYTLASMKNASGVEILNARTVTPDQVHPTVMSQYGNQHNLSRHTLERKGYFGCFLKNDSNLRLMHPAEIQMAHITYGEIFVHHALQKSWVQTGNMITFPHAALMLTNAINMLDTGLTKLDMHEVFDSLFQNRLRASFCTRIQGDTASMFVRNHDTSRDWVKCLENYEQLQKMDCDFNLPVDHVWLPSEGLVEIGKITPSAEPPLPVSEISTVADESSQEEPSATVPFQTMLRNQIVLTGKTLVAWIYPDTTPQQLISHFQGQMFLEECNHEGQGFAFRLKYHPRCQELEEAEGFVMTCMQQHTVMFWQLDPKKVVQEQLDRLMLSHVQFDQFGVIAIGQKFYQDTMLLDFRPMHTGIDQNLCIVLAAFQNVQTSFLTDVSKMQTTFKFQGDEQSRRIIAAIWFTLFDHDTLKNLMVKVSAFHSQTDSSVRFDHQLPLPSDAFSVLLTVLATRRLLDTLNEPGQPRVVLRWRSKTIWDGCLNPAINMITIAAILKLTFFPRILGRGMRLMHLAKQCCNVTVAQLLEETKSTFVMIQLFEELVGGTGSKESQKTWISNSLAGTLLEQGFTLDWVASTTETLMKTLGIKATMQIAKLPPGKQRVDALLKLCEDCSLKPPPKMIQAAGHVAQKGPNPRKKVAVQINPAEYQIEPGFFLTQSDEPVQQIYEVRNKSSGVILMSLDFALPWIKESQRISADELAIIVPGAHSFETTLKCETMHVPCKDANLRPVILQATVVQLGELSVKTQTSEQPVIDELACSTVAITFWRDEWKQEEWNFIVDKPFAFARQQLAAQGHESLLMATWGKSLRHERQPATSQHATSVQLHATLPKDKLKVLLTISGFNRMWVTPKNQMGRLDTAWRIIWIEGTWAHLNTQASKVVGCSGLVRSKSSYGLRFSNEDYAAAWKILCPEKAMPTAHDTTFLFQIQSLPYGCSSEMLQKWSEANKWPCKPIKALGPASWLVGSQIKPPSDFMTFNGKPVLVKFIPPKDSVKASPIVAGPLPNKFDKGQSQQSAAKDRGMLGGPLSFDPWAQSAQAKGLPAILNRDHQGPTETKLHEQDDRIETQNQKIAVIEQALEQLRSDTKTGFEDVQKREQQSQAQVQAAIQTVKHDLEQTFQQAICQQSTQLNSTLQDLRSLLQAKPKRSRTADDSEMED